MIIYECKKLPFTLPGLHVSAFDVWLAWRIRRKSLATKADIFRGEGEARSVI
jgi:hypothetical protein